MNIQDSVFAFFVEEAAEHLSVLEAGLLQLEKTPGVTPDLPQRLFRAAHTLKGSANLVKFNAVGSIAHQIEDILEAISLDHLAPTPSRLDALLYALDQIRELIRLKKQNERVPENLVEMVRDRLNAIIPVKAVSANGQGPPEQVTQQGSAGPVNDNFIQIGGLARNEETGSVRVKVENIEALMELIGEFTLLKNQLLSRFQHIGQMQKEVDSSSRRLLKEVDDFTEGYEYSLPVSLASRSAQRLEEFQELEFDRYDELSLYSRKLREISHDISEALRESKKHLVHLNADIQTMDRAARQMKERISESRTVPAGILFQRFKRTIRSLSENIDKKVELFVAGEETPLDRIVHEGLFDPLLHIMTNSLAHGIESQERRRELGKPEAGRIWLSAERQGNMVEISIRDDGQGLQLEKIRNRALDLHFIEPGQDVSSNELIQMIFRPGFSTTAEVDSTSGRGVGMNVVLDRLSALNGTIDVESVDGQGSTFRLKLPLSLVVVNVIKFSVGDQLFVIPSALVDEVIDLSHESDLDKIESSLDGIDRLELGRLFCMPKADSATRFGILTRSEGESLLLMVDQFLGQEDTVLKPFGSFVSQIEFFSGTSLTGDGVMCLVVDPTRMKFRNRQQDYLCPLPSSGSDTEIGAVLVVDDSLSVRKYAVMLLESNGFRVLTAADGLEALELLDREKIISIVTDLEMPVMHGYDFLAELKRRDGFGAPVAVLTSRAGDQHQAKAISLGATDYLVKPFEDQVLVDIVRKHLKLSAQTG